MEIKLPRLLIIDDDPEICSALSAMLRREGFWVCTAEDGPSALEKIKASHFDLLITDVSLPPPIDGIETVRQARESNPGLRSLFVSGKGFTPWADPDNDDFVSKPFHARELVGCIWELFSRRLPPA